MKYDFEEEEFDEGNFFFAMWRLFVTLPMQAFLFSSIISAIEDRIHWSVWVVFWSYVVSELIDRATEVASWLPYIGFDDDKRKK